MITTLQQEYNPLVGSQTPIGETDHPLPRSTDPLPCLYCQNVTLGVMQYVVTDTPKHPFLET